MSVRKYVLESFKKKYECMGKRIRRSRMQIMAEILSLCRQPQSKTRVMYGTNLSWGMLQKYLSLLQSMRLLEAHYSQTTYVTTQKGLQFVEKWREIVELSLTPHTQII